MVNSSEIDKNMDQNLTFQPIFLKSFKTTLESRLVFDVGLVDHDLLLCSEKQQNKTPEIVKIRVDRRIRI